MEEKISDRTKDTLGKIIKKPPLTHKLLSKPPFRFLHDIFTEVIKVTKFMEGLYTKEEMNSQNVKDKDSKIAFLQKAIDCVSIATGKNLSARPSKIVAGHEPEKTNELLQAISAAITDKVDSSDAVKKVLSGAKPGSRSARSSSGNKREATSGKISREKETDNNQAGVDRRKKENDSKDVSKHPEIDEKANQKVEEERSQDTNLMNVSNNDKRSVDSPKESEQKQHEDRHQNNQRPSSPKGSRTISGSPNGEPKDGPIRSAKSDRQRMNGIVNDTEETPQRVYSGHIERPSSARPAPPRPRKPGSGDDRSSRNSGSGKNVTSVIVDNANEQESDDETFVVEETQSVVVKEEPPPDNIEIENEEHGGLVKKILETKKELEKKGSKARDSSKSIVSDATRKKERELVEKEIEKLRTSIQNLCRSANPLGKIMDYVQEDIDSMKKELESWKSENTEHELALKRERNTSENAIEPLKTQLKEIELAITDKIDLISTVKGNILKNEEKIQKMLNGIFSPTQ